ncbi:hypothetical protein HON71_00760 [Candidatus Woesearchaeota archaeon]|jgi:hypothetical protein|nr:hypothetical protein [Candidatus Woesearchaeota archaeon]MBT6774175.1 hypothetical protein [Candidatus Woesearchaeota archaeon]
MVNNDLVEILEDFDDAMVTIQQNIVEDNAYSCQECGDTYHTDYVQLTGNDCPACYKDKNFNIRSEQPVSVIGLSEPDFNRIPGDYQEPHHCVDRAVKAHEETGGVFDLGRKIL